MQLTNQNGIMYAMVRLAATVASAALLASCAGNSSLSSVGGLQPGAQFLAPASHVYGTRPPCPIPDVWNTNGPANQVIGYSSAGSVCITLTSANGIPFSQPQGLATDQQGYLYVADIFNNRIVVLDQSGAYWSTLSVPNLAPSGVCVSRTGLVGVVTNSGTGVDFYTSKGAFNSVSTPSSITAALGSTDHSCAFDRRGDFFASGYNGTYVINYLRYNYVNIPNVTVQTCTAAICTGHQWLGMYVHSHSILSVMDYSGPDVKNMEVGLGAGNLLTFTSWSPHPITALTGYTSTCPQVGAVAPTVGNGNASRLYVSECNGGSAIYFANNVWTGGTLNFFALGGSVGLATYPTGQW